MEIESSDSESTETESMESESTESGTSEIMDLNGENVYEVTVTCDPEGDVLVGSTVTLTAEVTCNGDPVTDLKEAGLRLRWEEDGDAIYNNG